MGTFVSNTFVGQRIQIDGHEFNGNSFANCVLVYGGGPLHFVNNTMNNVNWEFVDAAARTVALISSLYQSGEEGRAFVDRLLATFGKPVAAPAPTVAQAHS